ncbi:MRG/MORF4L-binding protein-like [Daphnia pulicaria]|uniref:MRG/MORF4L-binding protein-like n=1 Tax=Daphnia pulicaria TaxID=35523 RepID=UPI001EEB2EE4|nr:MRG/MORF4L-binding protein-like [Daphnia pulicaria]
MAVKEKTEGNEETLEAAEVEWGTVDNELQLLQILCGTRPIGISKYFQMACIVEKLAMNLNKEVTSKGVWDHLASLYDLKKLDEHEKIPFPNEEMDFVLSTDEYGELMDSKFKDAESKKVIKKEKEEVKKEKVPETPQPIEKKAVKRTRASTAPSPGTLQITPKRRRI